MKTYKLFLGTLTMSVFSLASAGAGASSTKYSLPGHRPGQGGNSPRASQVISIQDLEDLNESNDPDTIVVPMDKIQELLNNQQEEQQQLMGAGAN